MNSLQKTLILAAANNSQTDPVYAQELIEEVFRAQASILTDTKWFHGDQSQRSNFNDHKMDRDRKTSSSNSYGPGIYFTNKLEVAEEYGKYLYEGIPKSSFNILPETKATYKFTEALYAEASEEDKEVFLSNWDDYELKDVLKKYTHGKTYNDVAIELYGDLFRYNYTDYIYSLKNLGYDGSIHKIESSRFSDDLYFLVVWNTKKIEIEAYEHQEEIVTEESFGKDNKDKPSYRDLKDAVEYLNESIDTKYDIKDFDLSSLGYLPVSDLYEYEDIDRWLDIEDGELENMTIEEFRDALNYFRNGYGDRAVEWIDKKKFPPIVVIEGEDAEGRPYVDIGDGRGRVNVANGLNMELPVWIMTPKKK